MILLNFTVRNHKSIRDEVTLSLTKPTLKTLRPKNDDWAENTYPLLGIFGGNATGKSTILDALLYTFAAIQLSATTWQGQKTMAREPFKLDGEHQTSSSTYELELVHEGIRYEYGFEVDKNGIKQEWLKDVPSTRWRTLLNRDRDTRVLSYHPSLGSKIEVTSRELVLSRALLLPESKLHSFAQSLVENFDIVLVKDSHREARLKHLTNALSEGDVTFSDLEALLQVADIGVTHVSVEETKIPERIRQAFNRLRLDLTKSEESKETTEKPLEELNDNELEQVARYLLFHHRGAAKECPPFSVEEESDGTIAWLSIAVPALDALRYGGILLIDEIDASLHPHLLDLLLNAFADPSLNTKHAQLMFTSHESYVLSKLSDVELEPEQIWFTDKNYEGATELTCLADFPKHPDANVAKRYLTGRYGGTPRLSPSLLAVLVNSSEKRPR